MKRPARRVAALRLIVNMNRIANMSRIASLNRVASLSLGLNLLASGCSPNEGPQTGTQTNWLRSCSMASECSEGLRCVCGTCTTPVTDDPATCDLLDGASFVPADDAGVVALCGGVAASEGLCLARCDDGACPDGSECLAGICSPLQEATALITIDVDERHQTLLGFGAGIAFIESELVHHPEREALFDVMFVDSGFDALRLRNVFTTPGASLNDTVTLISAATERLGRSPTIVLTSSSPPAELKANASPLCAGNWDTCTLTRNAEDAFDYAGFAAFWRDSLDSYIAADLTPDFLSIQNDANWVPPASNPIETCRFLPEEGAATVNVDAMDLEIEYPGYVEALRAVRDAMSDLDDLPSFVGPEATGVEASVDFVRAMDEMELDAIAHHMYGIDALAPDREALTALGGLGVELNRPLLQTEMTGAGLEAALFAQHALVDIGASLYLQTDLVASAGRMTLDQSALVSLTENGFTVGDSYYALQHFARATDPGWTRVAADSTRSSLLVSAWLSPQEESVTLVLINASTAPEHVGVDLDEATSVHLTRTVFSGVERHADLGELQLDQSFELPARAMATVTIER